MNFIMEKSILITILNIFILIGSLPHNLGNKLTKLKIPIKNSPKEKTPRNLESDNYIVLYFNQDFSYSGGFQNSVRDNISYIINQKYQYKKYTSLDVLDVYKGFGIEIHFNTPIKSLEFFFEGYIDTNMQNLVFIDFSNFISISVLNMESLFSLCYSLKSIDLTNFDTSKVTDMGHMFYNCYSLESIDLTNFDTSKVTNMEYMFFNCSSLKSIDLSNFVTSKVTDMEYMFCNCSSLKSLDLSSFNTFKVTDMKYMFYNCSSLTSIDISNFDMLNCYSYYSMFHNINDLNYINLYNLKNDKIISIYFYNTYSILFVCQKNKIIDNAYNCCNSNFQAYDCISSNNENNIPTDNNNPNSENNIPTDNNNHNNENIIPTDNNNHNNENIIPTDNNNHNNENNITTDYGANTDNTNSIDNNSTIISENKSSNKISTGTIVGIILGGVAIVGGIIAIVIYCKRIHPTSSEKICPCFRKKQPTITEKFKTETTIASIKNNIYEYETTNDKENPILLIFTLSGVETRILIDYNKTIDELIRFYFNNIGRPDLYGDPSIYFLIGGNNITPPYTKASVETLRKFELKSIRIIVEDSQDKIKK